jgi:hypothetical protein
LIERKFKKRHILLDKKLEFAIIPSESVVAPPAYPSGYKQVFNKRAALLYHAILGDSRLLELKPSKEKRGGEMFLQPDPRMYRAKKAPAGPKEPKKQSISAPTTLSSGLFLF